MQIQGVMDVSLIQVGVVTPLSESFYGSLFEALGAPCLDNLQLPLGALGCKGREGGLQGLGYRFPPP